MALGEPKLFIICIFPNPRIGFFVGNEESTGMLVHSAWIRNWHNQLFHEFRCPQKLFAASRVDYCTEQPAPWHIREKGEWSWNLFTVQRWAQSHHKKCWRIYRFSRTGPVCWHIRSECCCIFAWFSILVNTGRKSSQTNLRKCTGSAGRGRRADVSAPLLGQLLFAQQRESVELGPTHCSTFVTASLSCVVYCELCTFQHCSSLRVRKVRWLVLWHRGRTAELRGFSESLHISRCS